VTDFRNPTRTRAAAPAAAWGVRPSRPGAWPSQRVIGAVAPVCEAEADHRFRAASCVADLWLPTSATGVSSRIRGGFRWWALTTFSKASRARPAGAPGLSGLRPRIATRTRDHEGKRREARKNRDVPAGEQGLAYSRAAACRSLREESLRSRRAARPDIPAPAGNRSSLQSLPVVVPSRTARSRPPRTGHSLAA
jgi:hypothetical protein